MCNEPCDYHDNIHLWDEAKRLLNYGCPPILSMCVRFYNFPLFMVKNSHST